MFQIEQIVTQTAEHFLQSIGIAVVKSGIRCDARTDLEQITIARILLHYLVDKELTFGTGTDKGHITTEHVPKLGKLIQVVVAKKTAYFSHTGVSLTGIQGRAMLLSIQLHAAKLIDVERTTETPDTLLLEDSGTTVFTLHRYITE